jgi:hypothetical protein
MFTKLLKWLFASPNQQQELDEFIIKHRPTTPAEVDYWVREFDLRKQKGYL